MDSTCATFDTTLVCFRPLIDPNYWIHDVGDSLKNAMMLVILWHMKKCIYSTCHFKYITYLIFVNIKYNFISNIKIIPSRSYAYFYCTYEIYNMVVYIYITQILQNILHLY